jgi:hypothetical protein
MPAEPTPELRTVNLAEENSLEAEKLNLASAVEFTAGAHSPILNA